MTFGMIPMHFLMEVGVVMRKFVIIISILFIVSLAFVGCGSQGTSSDSGQLNFTELETTNRPSASGSLSDESNSDEISVGTPAVESVSTPVPSTSPTLSPAPTPTDDSNNLSSATSEPVLPSATPVTSSESVQEGEIRYIVRVDMSAYLRKEANDSTADENIITYIPVLTKVLQLGQEGSYSLVDYNGTQGYVKSEFLAKNPFENTYWWWGRGVTNGTQYVMETLDDGSFYAVSMTGTEKQGYYQFDGDHLTLDDEKYHLVDGKFQTVEKVQAQSTYIYAGLSPITKEEYESILGTASTRPAPTTNSSEGNTQQSTEEYEIWTITKHNTGIFDAYREETYTLEWEPGIVHALLTKWDISDERFFMLISFDVDFDARTVDMCMDHFEGDAGYTKLVIDLAKQTSYGADYYDSRTGRFQ